MSPARLGGLLSTMLGARPGHFPSTVLGVIDLALCADCSFSNEAVYKDQTNSP